MVALTTLLVLGLGAVSTYFAIGALTTLAHWLAVAGGFIVFAGLTYTLIEEDVLGFLPFESELVEALSAMLFSVAAGVLSYRLFEAVFSVLGFGGALIVVVLVGASIVFSPFLVANVVGTGAGAALDVLTGGD